MSLEPFSVRKPVLVSVHRLADRAALPLEEALGKSNVAPVVPITQRAAVNSTAPHPSRCKCRSE